MQTLRRSSRRERYTLGGFANGEVGHRTRYRQRRVYGQNAGVDNAVTFRPCRLRGIYRFAMVCGFSIEGQHHEQAIAFQRR